MRKEPTFEHPDGHVIANSTTLLASGGEETHCSLRPAVVAIRRRLGYPGDSGDGLLAAVGAQDADVAECAAVGLQSRAPG